MVMVYTVGDNKSLTVAISMAGSEIFSVENTSIFAVFNARSRSHLSEKM